MTGIEARFAGDRSALMLTADDRIDRRILDEARSLVKAGWKVSVLAAQPKVPGDRHDEDLYPDVAIVRIQAQRPQASPYPIEPRFREASRLSWRALFSLHDELCREAMQRPATVYVAHDLPQLLAAAMAASYHHAHLVYDSHELYPEQTNFTRGRVRALLIALERELIPLADQVITVNQSIAEFMAQRYNVSVPEVILNSPALHQSLTLPLPHLNLFHQELKIPEDQLILLYQGGYARNRNLQNLVQAMGLVQNPKITLVLMGPYLAAVSELVDLTQQTGLLNKRVFFRESVSQSELLQYTASADAGIIPYTPLDLNLYYTTPNKLFEFIVAGLPILANDLPELNRFVSQQHIGVNMPMETAAKIAEAIDTFFQMDITLFRRQTQSLSPKYIWEVQGEKLVSLYQQLLTRPPRADDGGPTSTRSEPGNLASTSKPLLATTSLLAQADLAPLVSRLVLMHMGFELLGRSPTLAHLYYEVIRPRLK